MKWWMIGLVVTAVGAVTAPTLADEQQASQQISSVTLDVPGITCASCEMRIKSAISALSGVKLVEASAPDKLAVVQFDPAQANPTQFIEAIQKVGYLSSLAGEGYRCTRCKLSYPGPGQCIVCGGTLEPYASSA